MFLTGINNSLPVHHSLTRPELPQELLEIIVHYLAQDPKTKKKTLATLLWVSTRFHTVIRKHLYRSVTLTYYHGYEVQNDKAIPLLQHLLVESNSTSPTTTLFFKHLRTFTLIFGYRHNPSRAFGVPPPGQPGFPPVILRILQELARRGKIETLRIWGERDPHHTSPLFPVVPCLGYQGMLVLMSLRNNPHLRSLDLYGLKGAPGRLLTGGRSGIKLQELKVHATTFSPAEPPTLNVTPSTHAFQRLETLSLPRPSDFLLDICTQISMDVDVPLRPLFPALKTLAIGDRGYGTTDDHGRSELEYFVLPLLLKHAPSISKLEIIDSLKSVTKAAQMNAPLKLERLPGFPKTILQRFTSLREIHFSTFNPQPEQIYCVARFLQQYIPETTITKIGLTFVWGTMFPHNAKDCINPHSSQATWKYLSNVLKQNASVENVSVHPKLAVRTLRYCKEFDELEELSDKLEDMFTPPEENRYTLDYNLDMEIAKSVVLYVTNSKSARPPPPRDRFVVQDE